MPKPNIRKIVVQDIKSSIFEDTPSNDTNNNIPGWSFVNPLENKEQMVEVNVNDPQQKVQH